MPPQCGHATVSMDSPASNVKMPEQASHRYVRFVGFGAGGAGGWRSPRAVEEGTGEEAGFALAGGGAGIEAGAAADCLRLGIPDLSTIPEMTGPCTPVSFVIWEYVLPALYSSTTRFCVS